MKSRRRKLETVDLREDLVGLSKPANVVESPRTITLKGVKFLGLTSKNGRRYARRAIADAIQLYEGAKINIDHPDKPRDRRSAHDRAGKAVNIEQRSDGCLYGDAILLRRHPLAKRVADAVQEGMEDSYAFSHNADGEARTDSNGVLQVETITEVRSIDLVADGATNESLFESSEHMKTTANAQTVTLRELIEASDCDPKDKGKMLEADDEVLATELPAEPDGDWKADLVAAIGKLVASEDEADHGTAKKIMAMLQPPKAAADGDAKEEADGDEGKDTTESTRHRPKPGSQAITEAKAKDLCELAGIKPTQDLLECLLDLPEDKAVRHLKLFKAQAGGRALAPSGPRSSSPGRFLESDDERRSKPAKDMQSFVEALTSPDD